jgi:hypothetical protein
VILAIGFSCSILTGCIVVPPIGINSVKIIVQDHYQYFVYLDGNPSTGTYLGKTNWSGIGIFYPITAGDHSFYAISTDYLYDSWGTLTFYLGTNTIKIFTSYIW